MNLNKILKKMAVLLERKQDALFTYDIEKQKKYVEKLGEPRDDIERSYFQYKCQMKFNGKMITFLLNIVSFPLAIFYLVRYRTTVKVKKSDKRDCVFLRDGLPLNVLPNSLKKEYPNIESNPEDGFLLTAKDKKFIKKIITRYGLSWHFILKCIIKIGKYSYAIEKYFPNAIVVCAEYSFTSSVLTLYCRERKIKHIDVMHGEKLYYMRDSFFRFDECYIWDEHYKRILTSLKAEKTQFVVEVPPSLKFNIELIKTNIYDYTYYLGAETETVLNRISEILNVLYKKGSKISVRPHPRYSNQVLVRKLFSFANVENVHEISIEQSLLQTKAAISLYSTVLNQALYNSIPIVIDDVSNVFNYEKLQKLGYICIGKEHMLLSELLEKKYDRKS